MSCSDPYSIFNSLNNTCTVSCSLPNCAKCKIGSKKCEECATGFALYAWDDSCRPSPISNCLALHDWKGKEFVCSKCVTGRVPSKDQTECMLAECRTLENCEDCATNITVCSHCRVGYSWSNSTNTCVVNSCSLPNCLYCSASGTCLRCASSYSLVNNTCSSVPCSLPNCQRCKPNSIFCD